VHPTLVASFLICQLGSQLRTPHFGPRESHSLGAKAALVTQQRVFKRVKLLSAPTLVPPKFSHIKNRSNISSVKRDITASVCQCAICRARRLMCCPPAVVPVTVLQTSSTAALQSRQSSDVHPSYRGTVLFRNVFDGRLPATDYPKVNVCGYFVHSSRCVTKSCSFTSSCFSYTPRWQLPGVGYATSMLPKSFQYR
jgi:hypothetical protein